MKQVWAIALLAAWSAAGCQNAPPVASTMAAPTTSAAGQWTGEGKNPKWPSELNAALEELSSRDAAKRAAALEHIAAAIEHNHQDASVLLNLAGRFKENSVRNLAALLATEDIEARALIANLMDFDEALSRFLLVAAQEPEPRRAMLIQWGLSPAGAKVVAEVFSGDVTSRLNATHTLGAIDGEVGDWALARLIDDTEREVSLTAMNAAWEREPAPAVVDALWQKAVEYPLAQYQANMGMSGRTPKVLTVHGRTLQLDGYYNYALASRMMDGDVATDLLIAYKSDVVEKRLAEFVDSLTSVKSSQNVHPFQMLSSYSGAQGMNFERLLMAYRPKAAVVFLVRMVATNITNDGWDQVINNQRYRCSTRVDAIGILAKLTDQDRDEFNVVRIPQWGNRWMLAGSQDDEEKAAKKLLAWWKVHYKDYGAKNADINQDDLPKASGRTYYGRRGMMW